MPFPTSGMRIQRILRDVTYGNKYYTSCIYRNFTESCNSTENRKLSYQGNF